MAKSKKYVDPAMKMAKEALCKEYRRLLNDLYCHERYLQLKTNGVNPAAREIVDCGEFQTDAQGETLEGEVYIPLAPSGGILRLVHRCDGETYTTLHYWEQWQSRRNSSDELERRLMTLSEKTLAERLHSKIFRIQRPELYREEV